MPLALFEDISPAGYADLSPIWQTLAETPAEITAYVRKTFAKAAGRQPTGYETLHQLYSVAHGATPTTLELNILSWLDQAARGNFGSFGRNNLAAAGRAFGWTQAEIDAALAQDPALGTTTGGVNPAQPATTAPTKEALQAAAAATMADPVAEDRAARDFLVQRFRLAFDGEDPSPALLGGYMVRVASKTTPWVVLSDEMIAQERRARAAAVQAVPAQSGSSLTKPTLQAPAVVEKPAAPPLIKSIQAPVAPAAPAAVDEMSAVSPGDGPLFAVLIGAALLLFG